MFERKIKVVPTGDFMSGDWKEKEKERRKAKVDHYATKTLVMLAGGTAISNSQKAYAVNVEGIVASKIMDAFEPIIQLVQGVSYPIAFLMMSGGFVLIMTGQTARGTQMIKWACFGYLGLQFAPGLMEIIIEIGNSIRTQMG